MSRVDIAMTPEEVTGFLARCPQMVVGALDVDGWPTGTIAASTYCEDRLHVRLIEGDPVLALLSSGASMCCVADEHVSYFEIQGVIARGRGVPSQHDPNLIAVVVERLVSFDFGRLR